MKLAFSDDLLIKTSGAYLVGGSVRDILCRRQPTDYDVVVSQDPHGYATQLAHHVQGRLVVLGSQEFPLFRVVTSTKVIDITPMKGPDIQSDLQDRDFTVNALAWELTGGHIIDTTNGLHDLKEGVIRMVTPSAFQKDPVRLVRAFRLAARFDWHIEPTTMRAISQHADAIQTCAGERIWTELAAIFTTSNSFPQLQGMVPCGLLTALFPELEALRKCQQNKFHCGDGHAHTLLAFNALETLLNNPGRHLSRPGIAWTESLPQEQAVGLKLAILLHDIGKPSQRTTDAGGNTHFYGHAAVGARMAKDVCLRLRLPKRQSRRVEFIIAHHQHPLNLYLAHGIGPLSPRATGRFLRVCGELAPHIILHAIADHMGKKLANRRSHMAHMAFFETLFTAYLDTTAEKSEPPIMTGDDLMAAFGLEPSPLVGNLLKGIDEGRLAGLIKTRQEAMDWVKGILSQKE